MAEEPGSGAPRGVRRDSAHLDLGWCAGSSVQPRKQRAISGVSASSFVALQAQLYAAQEAAASLRQGGAEAEAARPRRLRAPVDGLGAANAGVREREARDAAQANAAGPAGVQSALERKAALYEQLSRGGGGALDPEDERFSVDFLMKARPHMLNAHAPVPSPADASAQPRSGDAGECNDAEAAEERRRQEARRVVDQLAAATQAGRERAAALRSRVDAAAGAQREALRAAFLRETAAKLRAAEALKRENGAAAPSDAQ